VEETKSEMTEQTPTHRFEDATFEEASKFIDRYADKLAQHKTTSDGTKRHLSPPMIQEYNPNEENARTRAKRRKDEISKREAVVEIDKTQYPEDPTPWKGR